MVSKDVMKSFNNKAPVRCAHQSKTITSKQEAIITEPKYITNEIEEIIAEHNKK